MVKNVIGIGAVALTAISLAVWSLFMIPAAGVLAFISIGVQLCVMHFM